MDFFQELQQIHDSGVHFTIERWERRYIVKLGDYHQAPLALAVVDQFGEAVLWLREQVKERYPHSAYARHLLIN